MQQNTLPITIPEDEQDDSKPEEPETIDELNSSSLQGKERSQQRHRILSENADGLNQLHQEQ